MRLFVIANAIVASDEGNGDHAEVLLIVVVAVAVVVVHVPTWLWWCMCQRGCG
jgi:hypothetical protein